MCFTICYRFVKKVYELDPSTTSVPWQPRGYVSKRKTTDSSQTEVKPKKICTPLLEKEVCKKLTPLVEYFEEFRAFK